MTLENLLKIGQLKPHKTSAQEILRLLASAKRFLNDARVEAISDETRFDAAYKSILQTALAGLMANGYRPDTKGTGHHMTIIQSLTKTVGLDPQRIVVLDALRRKRNLTDYDGVGIDIAGLKQAIVEAEALIETVEQWLAEHHPELLQ